MFLLRALGYLWALPHTIIGAIFLLFCKPSWVGWNNGALEVGCERIVGFETTAGQTHGWLVLLKFKSPEEVPSGLRKHEHRHVLQGMIGGPLYLIAYILCFLVLLAWYGDSRKAYEAIPFEKDAREAAQ